MKIYLLGDVGEYNKNTQNIFKKIKENKDDNDAILLLGDNFYPNGINSIDDKKWNNFKELNIDIPVWCVLGNHDYLGNVKEQIKFNSNNWNLPNYYYKKTLDNIDFFFIDTSILIPEYSNINYNIVKSKIDKEPLNVSKEMTDWLEDELKKSINPKVVVGHYPIFSYGLYGINKKLFDILFPIFSKHQVKYYISGHDHNLQIIDVATSEFNMKQIISGATSHIYPLLKNASNKIFARFGIVIINTTDKSVEIVNRNLKPLYKEKLNFD